MILAILCAVVSIGGLIASTFIKSAEDERARAAPPQASVLTTKVERRVLANTLVTRGTIVAEKRIEITPVVTGVGAQIVTGIYKSPGAEVHSGDVLVAVSGRPLIVLPGRVPSYRDLRPGDWGEDVKQAQIALISLGHYLGGDRPGYFGEATKAAVRSLYSKIRYDVPDTGGRGGVGDQAALEAARDAVEAAQRAANEIERRVAAADPLGKDEAPLADQLAVARTQLQRAKDARSRLISRTGPMLPLAEFVNVPQFPARVTDLSAKVGDSVRAPLIALAAGELTAVSRLRPDKARLLRPGLHVRLVSETLAMEADAILAAVGGPTVDPANGGGAPYSPVVIKPALPLGAEWAGIDVRVTVVSAQTSTAVLVVPLSAVSTGTDGRTTVSVLRPSGEVIRVEVQPGASGDGFVELRQRSDLVVEGDLVVVGASQ